jgi:tetratricopeptide (TPR) repeat protein
LGEFPEAMERGQETVRLAREVDHPQTLILAHRSLGFVALRRGDIAQAIPPLEASVELCRVALTRTFFDVSAAHLGYAYALSGRLREGVALMEEALADPGATGSTNHSLFLAYLAEAHLLTGLVADATTATQRALELAHRQHERGNEAWIFRLLGEIGLYTDTVDRDSTEAYYLRALSRATDLGMRPLVAHCHLGLGKLYGRTGKEQEASEHLTTAVTMYREMDMRFYLEQAEAEMRTLG